MSYSIDSKVLVPQGNTKFIPFSLSTDDVSGIDIELNNATILWKLQDTRTREEVLSLDNEAVSIRNRDNANAKFEIHLEPDATKEIQPSDYREVLTIVDGGGNRTTWTGNTVLILEDG